jgi:superfamily II DNA or RNA helicase
VTPKSRIEQAVGRIFRQKKEDRKFNPIIFDIIDVHDVLQSQYRKRAAFYKQCGYKIFVKEPGGEYRQKGTATAMVATAATGPLFRSGPKPATVKQS